MLVGIHMRNIVSLLLNLSIEPPDSSFQHILLCLVLHLDKL